MHQLKQMSPTRDVLNFQEKTEKLLCKKCFTINKTPYLKKLKGEPTRLQMGQSYASHLPLEENYTNTLKMYWPLESQVCKASLTHTYYCKNSEKAYMKILQSFLESEILKYFFYFIINPI